MATLGEYFIRLGIQGTKKSTQQLDKFSGGIKEVRKTSIGMKAAVFGLAYGLKRITSQSSQAGSSLNKFSIFTGLSAKKLQQWQWMARQTGVASDVVAASVKSVQSAMSNMILGKGPPEAMFLLSKYTELNKNKVRDTFYMMNKLAEFARKAPEDVGNRLLTSFGISEEMIVGLRNVHKYQGQMKNAPVYSGDEIKKLKNISVMWSKITYDMDLSIGKFIAEHGSGILKQVGALMQSALQLAGSIARILGDVNLFAVLSKIPEGIKNIVTVIENLIIFASKNLGPLIKTISGGFGLGDLLQKFSFKKLLGIPEVDLRIKKNDTQEVKDQKIKFIQDLQKKSPEEKYKSLDFPQDSLWNNAKDLFKSVVFSPGDWYTDTVKKSNENQNKKNNPSRKIQSYTPPTIASLRNNFDKIRTSKSSKNNSEDSSLYKLIKLYSYSTIQKFKNIFENTKKHIPNKNTMLKLIPNNIISKVEPMKYSSASQRSALNVNQILNFKHAGKNAVEVQSAARLGVQDAYRLQSNGQEN